MMATVGRAQRLSGGPGGGEAVLLLRNDARRPCLRGAAVFGADLRRRA